MLKIINNKYKCKIIYNYQEYELNSKFNVDNIKQLEIELNGILNITNMNRMFFNCSSLTSLPDISNWDIKKVTNMSSIFSHCLYYLIYLNGILKMLIVCIVCFIIAHHYHHYLIYLNGILKKLIIWIKCLQIAQN